MLARRVCFSVFLSLAALTLAACGSRSALPPRSIAVELTEFAINPNTYLAQVNEPLTFLVANTGVLDHDVTIIDTNGKALAHIEVKPGQTASLYFQPSASGELQLICSVAGHAKAGMTAKLSVGPTALSAK